VKQDKRLVREFGDIECAAPREAVCCRQNRQAICWIEQPIVKTLVIDCYERQEDVTAREPLGEAGTAILNELNFHTGAEHTEPSQKLRKRALDDLWRRTYAQNASLAFLQRSGALGK
jgi:hypothetical protein